MSFNSLILEPNPTIISKTGPVSNKGTASLKNRSNQLILFQVFFDPEVFSGISPACGELEPGASRTLSFFFEDVSQNLNEISFNVKYTLVPKNSSDKIADMMLNSSSWENSLTGSIHFSSHAEDAMKSISSSFKSKQSLKKAIERGEASNMKRQHLEMLEKKISEKEATLIQLQNKVQSLQQLLDQKKEESKKLNIDNTLQYNFIYFGFIVLFLAILKRWLF